MSSSVCLSTRPLKLSSQNKSNRQSIDVELRRTKLLASSPIEKNSVKTSMMVSKHERQLWAVSRESCPWLLRDWMSSTLWISDEITFPDLLCSWAWTQATLSNRGTTFSVLNEATVLSDESCNMRSRLLEIATATSGLQADCSRVSNKADNSGCH